MEMNSLMRAIWAVFVVLVVVQTGALAAPRVSISSTVRLYSKSSAYNRICASVLGGAKAAGSHAIQFIPTQHFIDANADGIPDKYCFAGGQNSCITITRKAVLSFQKAMTSCFRKAVQLGFRQIVVTPHLNDGAGNIWRNTMKIDPYKKYSGHSYYDFFIDPILRATKALPPKFFVFFNVQGEMNGALIAHPTQWRTLLMKTKRNIQVSNKYVGLNLNFNKVCPWCTGGDFRPSGGSNEQFDNKAIQSLFRSTDYLGTSAYAPTWYAGDTNAYMTPAKIEASLFVLQKELAYFGVDLLALNRAGKPIHYAEFGLGGATCEEAKDCVAGSAEQVAKTPFFGIGGDYNPNNDPWKNQDNANFRREFYKKAITYASMYRSNQYKVTHIFNWNVGSYDVQGLYPGSTNAQGSWKDAQIAAWITNWNKKGRMP